MQKIILILVFVWLVLGGGIFWLVKEGMENKWLSPMAKKVLQIKKSESYEVIGFLPPWNINKAIINPEILDQLIFLGIEVEADGDLVWDSQSRKIYNSQYLEMKQKMKDAGKKNVLGIKLFEDKKIDALVKDKQARDNLINQVKATVKGNDFDGVNVDFEYMGDPAAVLEDEFAQMLGELRQAVGVKVSVDVFANTIIKGDADGLVKMAENVDEIIVMGYDFVRPGMDYAGATSPIGSVPGKRNIMEIVDRVVALGLPKEKVILAYPLYGYEFKTVDDKLGSRTIGGWGQTATMGRVEGLIKDNKLDNLKINWDEISLTPWLTYTNTETAYKTVRVGRVNRRTAYEVEVNYQIYYENERSLKAKFNLVKQSQLGGVGFWALGYEGDSKYVWDNLKLVLNEY